MSTAAGNPGLRYPMSKPVGAKYRNNAESRSSLSTTGLGSDMPSMSSRSNLPDRTDSKVGLFNRHDTRTQAKDEDVVAVKDIEYIDSFPVVGEDQSMKTDYVRKYLLDTKNTSRTKSVQLVISLSEIRVYDSCRETPMMTHALKRIAFATCSAEHRHFSFVAREPKGSTDDQYCHAFLTRSSSEAEELNMLVASAFRLAYAQSQSTAAPTGHPVPAPSVSSNSSNQPLTPIPISGSPALTFQDMLRGPQRDTSFGAPVGPSWSPAHSSAVGGAPPGTACGDELSARLLQISTPNVDQMVLERRHRRNVEHSVQPGGVPGLEDANSSNISGGTPAVNTSPPSARESVLHRPLNFESSSHAPNGTVVARTALQSATDVNSAFDTMLMSSLLRTLKFGGGSDSRPYGSPVMILKELIDFHFVNRALNEDMPTLDRNFSPTTSLPFPVVQQSPQFTSMAPSRSDLSAAPKRSPAPPSSRSRPISGLFGISNGDGHQSSVTGRKVENDNVATYENTPSFIARRTDPQRNGDCRDDDLSRAVWYQPGLPRETILEMLVQQDVGAFVVRDSTTHAGCYALSIRVPKYDNEAGISHYLITKTPRGTVKLKGMAKEWNSLTALVTHHTVMRELLPCLLVMPKALPVNGAERLISEC